jgi:hypothetical protein
MEKLHIFYKVIYLVDGRYYYGSHTGRLEDNYRGSNKVIHQILKKRGIKFLIRENLRTFNTREECLAFEDRFLKLYNLKDDPKSLNFKNSAKGGDTWSHMTEEDKLKRKSNLSSKISGERNGNYGKPMPEERKKKMIESKTGVPIHTEEHKLKTSIRVKAEWETGKRKNNLLQYCDNRKGKTNGEEWNSNISNGVKNSKLYKEGISKRSENKLKESNLRLIEVKFDILSGMTDHQITEKYNIKQTTLYTWKRKIKDRNI